MSGIKSKSKPLRSAAHFPLRASVRVRDFPLRFNSQLGARFLPILLLLVHLAQRSTRVSLLQSLWRLPGGY